MERSSRTEDYYLKTMELQEKLRRSEEERLKLEEKFNELKKMSRTVENEKRQLINYKYLTFLEENKNRQHRNEMILQSLERIETRAKLLAAKSDRFKMFRKQYDSYIKRTSQTKIEPQFSLNQSDINYKPRNVCRKLFDSPDKNTTIESKIEVVEQFLRDNFDNFPDSNLEKSKENMNDNKLFNIKSMFNDNLQKKVPESINIEPSFTKPLIYKNVDESESESLGNKIEEELERFKMKQQLSKQSEQILQNFKDIISNSEEKYGLKNNSEKSSPNISHQNSIHIIDNNNENIDITNVDIVDKFDIENSEGNEELKNSVINNYNNHLNKKPVVEQTKYEKLESLQDNSVKFELDNSETTEPPSDVSLNQSLPSQTIEPSVENISKNVSQNFEKLQLKENNEIEKLEDSNELLVQNHEIEPQSNAQKLENYQQNANDEHIINDTVALNQSKEKITDYHSPKEDNFQSYQQTEQYQNKSEYPVYKHNQNSEYLEKEEYYNQKEYENYQIPVQEVDQYQVNEQFEGQEQYKEQSQLQEQYQEQENAYLYNQQQQEQYKEQEDPYLQQEQPEHYQENNSYEQQKSQDQDNVYLYEQQQQHYTEQEDPYLPEQDSYFPEQQQQYKQQSDYLQQQQEQYEGENSYLQQQQPGERYEEENTYLQQQQQPQEQYEDENSYLQQQPGEQYEGENTYLQQQQEQYEGQENVYLQQEQQEQFEGQEQYNQDYSATDYQTQEFVDNQQYPTNQQQEIYRTEQEYIQGELNIDEQYEMEQNYEQEYQQNPENVTEQHCYTNEEVQNNTNLDDTVLQKDVHEPLLEKKLPNLAEILNTDSESIKQNTEISNDDFTFSK